MTMAGKWRSRMIWSAAAIGVVAAFAWALWPKPVLVDLATVGRGTLEVTVEDEGVTRIREVYTVSAPTAGKMLRSALTVGDPVVAGGTVVARFEPGDPIFLDARSRRVAEAAVEAAKSGVTLAQAQVDQARSQLAFARSDLIRAAELAERRTIPERSLEKARLDVATGESAVASALATLEVRRRELESARAQLIQPGEGGGPANACCIEVRSPVDGRVLKLIVESEQVVGAGSPLVEIGDPADLEIVVDLLSRDAVRVEPGQSARIESWGGEAVLAAKVRRVEPTGFTKVSALGIEEQRVKVVLDFVDPPAAWKRLGHVFRIVARIVVWRGEGVVEVPIGALFRSGDGWAVFVVADGRAQLRSIEIGERNQRHARVVSGLAEGERIVLHPSDAVRDGVRTVARPQ